MAELSKAGDRIILDLGEDNRRDVLFSVFTALWAADQLEQFAGQCLRCPLSGPRESQPTIDVEAVESGGKPLVKLAFGRWLNRVVLPPAKAIEVARHLRQAAGVAERRLRWTEERDPACVLS